MCELKRQMAEMEATYQTDINRLYRLIESVLVPCDIDPNYDCSGVRDQCVADFWKGMTVEKLLDCLKNLKA